MNENLGETMTVSMNRRIGYSDLFTDDPKSLADYIQGRPKDDLLKICSVLVNASQASSKLNDARALVVQWFSGENRIFRDGILSELTDRDGIANAIASLDLLEWLVTNEISETPVQSYAHLEVDLFKAYLLLNDEQSKIEEKAFKNLPPDQEDNFDERITAFILTQNYHSYDLTNYDRLNLLVAQVVKSILFFKYLATSDVLIPHLTEFCNRFDCLDWQEWLKKYLTVVLPVTAVSDDAFFEYIVSKDNPEYDVHCQFLDAFCTEAEHKTMPDFVALRSNPLYKVEDGRYMVLSKLFVIEKLYKSIQFYFSLVINPSLLKTYRIADFRSMHCDKFSEQILLYRILAKCAPKKWVHLTGEEFVKAGFSGEPDYYLRFKNKVFLFESKDVILKADEKQSRDYPILSKAIESKFYKLVDKNGNISKKAILQIIENIKRVRERHYKDLDNEFAAETCRIYPILVVHDSQFSCLGVNRLLQVWFQDELTKLATDIEIGGIHPLTVINIDTLINNMPSFQVRGKVRLEQLIEDYHNEMTVRKDNYKTVEKYKQALLNSFVSFDDYVYRRIEELNSRKFPEFVLEFAEGLITTEPVIKDII